MESVYSVLVYHSGGYIYHPKLFKDRDKAVVYAYRLIRENYSDCHQNGGDLRYSWVLHLQSKDCRKEYEIQIEQISID